MPELSPDASQLLKEASQDQHTTVIRVLTFEGVAIETNGKSFIELDSSSSERRWTAAFDELLESDLIRQEKDGIFKVTREGCRIAGFS